MRGIIIRTIEEENVDHFEIIGEERERNIERGDIDYIRLRRGRGNLQIQRINNITVNDGQGSNSNRNDNTDRINDNNLNQNLISSSENELNYNNKVNKSSLGSEKEKDVISTIRNKYQIGTIDKDKPKDSWNKLNNIQQTSKLFIYQKRNSYPYLGERRSSWNEKNRQQGIVNLSVIDDNKKNLEKNEEIINLNQKSNNIGINFNDLNLQSSSRPIRKINNDYDVDGLDINNNININIADKKDIEEDQKEDKKLEKRDSKDSKKSKKSGNLSDKEKNKEKTSPQMEQLNFNYGTNNPSLHSSQNNYKNLPNQQIYKQPPSTTSKIMKKEPAIQDKYKKVSKISINLNDDDNNNINKQFSPSSSMINKKSQSKPSEVTYMIDSKTNKKRR
jgi:hypothetical protein